MIRALLFDFDGLVVDTEGPTYESWREIYREHGADLPLSVWLAVVGSGSSLSGPFDAVAELERRIGRRVDREALIERRTRRKLELCARAGLCAGVADLLAEARELGLATALVTNNRDEWVREHLARVRLEHRWDAVVCANGDHSRGKIELYRRALASLGVRAAEGVAVEDSPHGARAAKAAGLLTVVVPNEVTRGADFEGFDVVLPSLAARPLREVLAELEGRG